MSMSDSATSGVNSEEIDDELMGGPDRADGDAVGGGDDDDEPDSVGGANGADDDLMGGPDRANGDAVGGGDAREGELMSDDE
jgi:hypothetical protein